MNLNFEAMQSVDVRTVDRDTLVDIRNVHIDKSLPQRERILEYIRQVKNPYCYKCGDIVVKERFSDNGKTIEDCLEQYMAALV